VSDPDSDMPRKKQVTFAVIIAVTGIAAAAAFRFTVLRDSAERFKNA